MATAALGLEQSGLSYQRVPPGYRFPYGHTHRTQEEVYVVVRGSGRMKIDDEIVELREWDAVRVPPGMWRGYEAGVEGLEILVIGAPSLGDAPREDVEGTRDWWVGYGCKGSGPRPCRPRPKPLAGRSLTPRSTKTAWRCSARGRLSRAPAPRRSGRTSRA